MKFIPQIKRTIELKKETFKEYPSYHPIFRVFNGESIQIEAVLGQRGEKLFWQFEKYEQLFEVPKDQAVPVPLTFMV